MALLPDQCQRVRVRLCPFQHSTHLHASHVSAPAAPAAALARDCADRHGALLRLLCARPGGQADRVVGILIFLKSTQPPLFRGGQGGIFSARRDSRVAFCRLIKDQKGASAPFLLLRQIQKTFLFKGKQICALNDEEVCCLHIILKSAFICVLIFF